MHVGRDTVSDTLARMSRNIKKPSNATLGNKAHNIMTKNSSSLISSHPVTHRYRSYYALPFQAPGSGRPPLLQQLQKQELKECAYILSPYWLH